MGWFIGAAVCFGAGYLVSSLIIGWHETFNRRPRSEPGDTSEIVKSAKVTAPGVGIAAVLLWAAPGAFAAVLAAGSLPVKLFRKSSSVGQRMSDPMRYSRRMKRNTTRNKAVKTRAPQNHGHNLPDLDLLAEVSAGQVEHRTVLEFLRSIPHGWQADDIVRFGDKVKRIAEAVQLPFVPQPHPQLGVIRIYPVPLLEWVYTMLSKQFHWPAPALVLEDGAREQREELRRHEGAKKHLELAAEQHSPPSEVATAIKTTLDWLENEAQRLRGVEPKPTAKLHVVGKDDGGGK